MDRGIVDMFVAETVRSLCDRAGVEVAVETIGNDLEGLAGELRELTVPESSKFAETVEGKTYQVRGDRQYWHFSVRRILRNKNASVSDSTFVKRAYERMCKVFGAYSSTVLGRDLRLSEDIVTALQSCNQQFSLLGKLSLYDFDNPKESMFVVTRPLLVIPDFFSSAPRDGVESGVASWEQEHTSHAKEKGPLPTLRYLGRVSKDSYLRESGRLSVARK